MKQRNALLWEMDLHEPDKSVGNFVAESAFGRWCIQIMNMYMFNISQLAYMYSLPDAPPCINLVSLNATYTLFQATETPNSIRQYNLQ